jgi:hypothetical protein
MDRAVSRLDFRALADQTVYLDAQALKSVTDSDYLISSIRQRMVASGCILKEKQADADFIVEARAGAIGTDRHDLIYGVPSVNIPSVIPMAGMGIPTKIPEIPLITRTNQRGVAKIAVFAYNRQTGRPVWQSGAMPVASTAKAVWVFGAGPFQRGTIHEGTEFAGQKLNIPLIDLGNRGSNGPDTVSVADEAYFVETSGGITRQPTARQQAGRGAMPPGFAAEADYPPAPMPISPAGHAAPFVEGTRQPAVRQ